MMDAIRLRDFFEILICATHRWIDDRTIWRPFQQYFRWEVDNERLCAMDARLRLRRFRLERGSNSGPLDQ